MVPPVRQGAMLAVLAVAGGCPSAQPPSTRETIIVCGSSTMGRRLLPNLATRWTTGRAREHEDRPISDQHWCVANEAHRICVHYSGSGQGRALLDAGQCDIAMYSAPWSGDKNYAVRRVGTDAIMMVTRQGSPMTETTVPELSDAYASRRPLPGTVILKRADDDRSGTSEAFRRMLIDVPTLVADDVIPGGSPFLPLNRTDRWLYYVSAQEQLISDRLQILRVKNRANDDHGYLPSLETIQTGRYPLTRPLSLVVRTSRVSSLAREFVDYVASEPARPVFEALFMRHVTSSDEVSSRAYLRGPCDEASSLPPALGRRVNAIYYAPQGTTMPSVWTYSLRSSIDLARRRGEDLLIVGYASTDGSAARNDRFSRDRARATVAIARRLKARSGLTDNDPPRLHCAFGGETTVWGPRRGDNRVTVIRTVPPCPKCLRRVPN